jgi:hypothetical protein
MSHDKDIAIEEYSATNHHSQSEIFSMSVAQKYLGYSISPQELRTLMCISAWSNEEGYFGLSNKELEKVVPWYVTFTFTKHYRNLHSLEYLYIVDSPPSIYPKRMLVTRENFPVFVGWAKYVDLILEAVMCQCHFTGEDHNEIYKGFLKDVEEERDVK